MRLVLLLMAVMHTIAYADVNLLQSTPTTVAVSSTVDNAKIVPAHLVDGKLDTAWNSLTGDLAGAWIAVRVPQDAHVSSIKLTAGFVKQDKSGDLFAMNQRVTSVELVHDGVSLGTRPLDPELRTLQELAINSGGGDYRIIVRGVVAGSKPAWREVAISELEVWGTVPLVVPSRPLVRVGSLDVDCAKVMFPGLVVNKIGDDDYVIAIASARLSNDLVACAVSHGKRMAETSTYDLALVATGPKPSVVAKLPAVAVENIAPEGPMGAFKEGSVTLDVFALTDKETALIVGVYRKDGAVSAVDDVTESTLYRVTRTTLTPVLEFKSSNHSGNTMDNSNCTLALGKARKPLPDLDVKCELDVEPYHGEGPRRQSKSIDHFRWKDGKYQP